MKAKITKPDGTVIEAEGTPEEIAILAGWQPQTFYAPYAPISVPSPFFPVPVDPLPPITWTVSKGQNLPTSSFCNTSGQSNIQLSH